MSGGLYSLQVVIDENLGWDIQRKQVRFPRSKKVRIRRKWEKNQDNWKTFREQRACSFRFGNRVVMNRLAYEKLKSMCN